MFKKMTVICSYIEKMIGVFAEQDLFPAARFSSVLIIRYLPFRFVKTKPWFFVDGVV